MRDDCGSGDWEDHRGGSALLQAFAVRPLRLSTTTAARLASRAAVGYYLAQFRHDLGNVGVSESRCRQGEIGQALNNRNQRETIQQFRSRSWPQRLRRRWF